MLKLRIITAVILIGIIFAVLFYLPPLAFFFLTVFIALTGAWEWSNLMELKKTSQRILYLVLVAITFFAALYIPILLIFFATFLWWLFALVLILLYPRWRHWWGKSVYWRGLMGLLVLVPCWVAFNFIRSANDGDGVYALLFLFALIAGADSAAYFVGKKWGKNKLAPHVSPGKSLQGLGGAVLYSLLIALVALWTSHIPLQVWPWAMGLSLITVLFSVVGDLFESMLKRQANLKDSGYLLPGHGGLLDRIDSYTAAAPIFALGAMLLGMYLD